MAGPSGSVFRNCFLDVNNASTRVGIRLDGSGKRRQAAIHMLR